MFCLFLLGCKSPWKLKSALSVYWQRYYKSDLISNCCHYIFPDIFCSAKESSSGTVWSGETALGKPNRTTNSSHQINKLWFGESEEFWEWICGGTLHSNPELLRGDMENTHGSCGTWTCDLSLCDEYSKWSCWCFKRKACFGYVRGVTTT